MLSLQNSSRSFAGIELAAGAGTLTFSSEGGGSAKTISIGSSGVVNNSSNTLTFEVTSKVNIALSANASFTANGPIVILDDSNRTTGFNIGGFTLTLDGTSTTSTIEKGFIGTGGSVVKSGTGTWTIAGVNSYTGSTTLSGGTLSVSTLAHGGTASNLGSSTSAAANLVFNGGTLRYTGAAVSLDRLFTLTSSGGTIEASGTGALTFSSTGSIAFGGTNTSPTLTLSGSHTGTNTLTPVLGNNGTGSTSLTKSGTGTWALTGNNTLTGTVTVSAGTLTINSGASLGGSTVSLVVDAGTLNLNHTSQTIAALSGGGGTINLGTGHSLTASQSGTTTFAGVLAGSGNLTKSGSGNLSLSNSASTFTGTTTVAGGTLTASTLANVGTASSLGAPTTAANATIRLGSGTTGGALAYTGAATSTDRVIDLAGTTGGATLDASGTGALSFTSAFTATGVGAKTLTLSGSSSAANTIAGAIVDGSGTTSLAKLGTGTWLLSGNNTYTGATTISAGTLRLGAAGSGANSPLGTTAAGTSVTATGAALDLNGFTLATAESLSLTGTGVSSGGALTNSSSTAASYSGTVTIATGGASIGGTGNITLTSALAGDNLLTKTGTNTLTLSAASTRAGGTRLDAGTLRLGAPSALGNVSQTVTLNGGTLDLAIDSSVAAHPVSVAASSTISSNRATSGSGLTHTFGTLAIGTGTLSINAGANISTNSAYGVTFGATTLSGNATFDVANNGTATGTLTLGAVTPSGSGSLTKTGAGTLVFTGANTFGGGITLSAGRIVVDSGAFLASSSAPLTVSGGSLLLNNTSQTVASLQFSSGSLSGSLTLGGLGSAWTGGGSFSGSGTLTVANTANLAVSGTGDRDFNGYNIVNQGTVNWSGANLRAGGGSVFTNSGTINDTNTGAVGISLYPDTSNFSFANSGNYTKSGGAITTISIPFANTGNVTVTGTGSTLRFTGTYTQTAGSLSVGSGALARFDSNVTLAGAVTGAGTVQAPTVTVSGELRPGSSPGSLTINGNLTLAATSALLIEIGGTTQGTDYDFLSVTGNASLGGDLRVTLVNGFSSSINSGHNFTILTAGSAPSGSFANITNQRVSLFSGIGSFQVSFSGNSVVLSDFTPIPEPSTWALLGLGSALTLLSTLRRRSVLRVPRR